MSINWKKWTTGGRPVAITAIQYTVDASDLERAAILAIQQRIENDGVYMDFYGVNDAAYYAAAAAAGARQSVTSIEKALSDALRSFGGMWLEGMCGEPDGYIADALRPFAADAVARCYPDVVAAAKAA